MRHVVIKRARERGPTVLIRFKGESVSFGELTRRTGLLDQTLRNRYAAGDRDDRLVRPSHRLGPLRLVEKLDNREVFREAMSERHRSAPRIDHLIQKWQRAVFPSLVPDRCG